MTFNMLGHSPASNVERDNNVVAAFQPPYIETK